MKEVINFLICSFEVWVLLRLRRGFSFLRLPAHLQRDLQQTIFKRNLKRSLKRIFKSIKSIARLVYAPFHASLSQEQRSRRDLAGISPILTDAYLADLIALSGAFPCPSALSLSLSLPYLVRTSAEAPCETHCESKL